MEVLTGVTSALVAVILTLVAVIRFYLPRANRHNPNLEEELREVRRGLEKLNDRMLEHNVAAEGRHRELMVLLDEIRRRVP